ncbi:MAG TPA: hypothetical protein VFI15_08865, partial [Candidatus Limnocylindrales bacterium]|nr:hypothetical protein [Candidatus Limnocylindrales bacterium]
VEPTLGLAALTPFPPEQVREAIAVHTGIGVDPLTVVQAVQVAITRDEAIQTALASRGVGFPGPDGHGEIVWTSVGFVFLANYTPAVGPAPYGGGVADRTPFPAYLVQVVAPPIAGFPGFNTALVVVDARSGQLARTTTPCNGPLCNLR